MAQPINLTIASYNIHGCLGVDRRSDPDRIVRVIREFNTDIVALQEVKSRLGRADDLQQLNYIATKTDFEGIPGPALLRPDAPCGTALLTRYPVRAVRRIDLSEPGREPRGALDVDLEVRGMTVRIVSTHLGLRGWERWRQATRLLQTLSADQSRLVILTGDINEWFPWGRVLRLLHRQFGKSPAPRTFPSLFPVLALDRLWVGRQPQVIDMISGAYKTRLSRIASDHLPLVAKITLRERV